MEEILMNLASKEGLFACLFVALFIFTIVDSRKREAKLMDFMNELTKQFEALARQYEKLSNDVDDIKEDMKDILRK